MTTHRAIHVYKFGSSVLRDADDLTTVVHEIYRSVRDGCRVVAVVSAMGQDTDRLLASAQAITDEPEPEALAALLATGEAASQAQLAIALDRAGIEATVLEPARVGLHTCGPLLDSKPSHLEGNAIEAALSERPVVVVSGFVGTGSQGQPTLLGRGGSDLTAIFLAQRLDARECRLYKDTAGLYERDPNETGPVPRRYATICWDDALKLDPRVVQPKAVHFARDHGQPFSVTTLLADHERAASFMGDAPSCLVDPAPHASPRRVILLGLGTVGLGVYRHLIRLPHLVEVVGVLVRDAAKHREDDVPRGLLHTDPVTLLEMEADMVIETTVGRQPATRLLAAAIDAGRDVVTASKEVVSHDGDWLATRAAAAGVYLRYAAAVGGAVPALEEVDRLLTRGGVREIAGVLNGTANYVLDRVDQGVSLDAAVADAQQRGYAEADPSDDLDGTDAANKLAILARQAFGMAMDPAAIPRRGLLDLDSDSLEAARASGRTLRLVARCRSTADGLEARVSLDALAFDHPLAGARGVKNRVVITPQAGDPVLVSGKGAGRWPTAEAVVADVIELVHGRQNAAPDEPLVATTPSSSQERRW